MSPKVKKIFKTVLLITFCISNLISVAHGSCEITLPEDILLRPNFLVTIGSQKSKLIINKADTTITFLENQVIEAACETTFTSPAEENGSHKILIRCENRNLYLNNNCCYNNYNRPHLECSSQKWNLYETFENFIWCPSNTTSYLLARPKILDTNEFQYLAGLCYDTFNISFKSLYYAMSPKHSDHKQPTNLNKLYKPSLKIKYLKETFGTKNVLETDYEDPEIKNWINYLQYNYSSIVQNSILSSDFNHELEAVLELPWWPHLRLGNWKRYENALTKHNQSYDILAGVSSIATVPIVKTCDTNFTLEKLINDRHQKIPLYVWHYLRSTTNSSDEIVVIGVNSPFIEFYDEKDVIFCPDKCSEIPWLEKVSTTFRYAALGTIFCCSSEDVKASKRLDGFPDTDMNLKPQTSIKTKKARLNAFETTINYDLNSYEREYEE